MQYAKQKQKQIVLEGAVTGYRTMIAETENQFDMQDVWRQKYHSYGLTIDQQIY